MRRKSLVFGIVTILVTASVLGGQGGQAAADEASRAKRFDNSDVIELLKAGMDNSVIIAKVKQAPEVDFRLETEDLVALKKAGAGPDIISEMLARATPASRNEPKSAPSLNGYGMNRTGTAILVSREGRQEIEPSQGEMSTAGFAPYYQVAFFNYPGLRANARTSDRRPSLLIHSPFDPNEHYYIGKLDPDNKINARSLKIKNKRSAFTAGAGVRPDEDWVVAYTAAEEEKGIWKMTPKIDLEPGEYGLFDGFRLFGFSVGR